MTDKEIIKALECHVSPNKCNECPYVGIKSGYCSMTMIKNALDLILRQQAEIERLKEVKHGHWIPQYVSSRGLTNIFSCSVCNESSYTNRKVSCHYKYCRNCGAKMEMFGNPEQVKEFAKDINVLANSEQAKGEENAEVKYR